MNSKVLSRFATFENSAYPQLWRGCVGAWCPSLGPSGARLHDYSRRMNWGTLTNMDPATDWVIDGGQYALDFDGSDDMVECNHAPIDGLTLFALSAWVRPSSTAARRTVLNQYLYDPSASNEVGWFLDMLSGGTIRGAAVTSQGDYRFADSTLALSTSRWNHVLCVRSAQQTVTVFVDGVQQATNSGVVGTLASITNTQTFQIGGEADRGSAFGAFSQDWSGQIDDVRLYNRALSVAEIRLLARRRGIAFTPRTRARATPEQAAATTNRRRRIICGSQC